VLFSPLLAVKPAKVRVSGYGAYTDQTQVAAIVAQVHGVPLPRLNTGALSRQLREVTGVKDATVTRRWPGGLTVRITPRDPVAAVPKDGAFALVDVDGVTVTTAPTAPTAPAGLPAIEAPLGDGGGARPMLAALVILDAMPAELRAEVAKVAAPTQDSVQMTLTSGVVIDWGGSAQVALKVRVLQVLRGLPQNAAVTYFDVSAPAMPITR
jgi:cell division protein FtsQ